MTVWRELPVPINLEAHKTRHEDGGVDEIDLTGLSGVPADVVAITDVDDEPVSGATTAPISSNWASDFENEQEEKHFISDRVIKALLSALWQDVDWDEVDLEDIDWDEWIEPAVLESNLKSDVEAIIATSPTQNDNRILLFLGV